MKSPSPSSSPKVPTCHDIQKNLRRSTRLLSPVSSWTWKLAQARFVCTLVLMERPDLRGVLRRCFLFFFRRQWSYMYVAMLSLHIQRLLVAVCCKSSRLFTCFQMCHLRWALYSRLEAIASRPLLLGQFVKHSCY